MFSDINSKTGFTSALISKTILNLEVSLHILFCGDYFPYERTSPQSYANGIDTATYAN